MSDILDLLQTRTAHADMTPAVDEAPEPPESGFSDEELLELWKDFRRECFEGRHVFERQWMRNLYYMLNRQWIEYQSRYGGWRDKRMAQWIPRPVTNKCKEAVQTIRAMFNSIELGVNVRPNGNDPQNVSAAATADALAPLLQEAHDLDHVLTEFDFWLCVTGNAFLHSYVDYDMKNGVIVITAEQCQRCGKVMPSTDLVGAAPHCPDCGSDQFQPAVDPQTGQPMQHTQVKGAPATVALSPLEVAFPNSYGRFSDIPGLVRLRWRTKRYFEQHPVLKAMVNEIPWAKSTDNPSLQLFRSLAMHNDLGVASGYTDSIAFQSQEDGIPEYEVHLKPTETYPKGLVFRVIGDSNPKILHLEESEAIPGPLPYVDASGTPLFTFAHAGYEHVGGRIIASGVLDPIIQKQDAVNRLDSFIELIVTRCANPGWMIPKGSNVERMTGIPGLVVYWDPLTVGGNAKPERFQGAPIDPALSQLREQYLRDIEELTGTFDIMKGAKPAGVEAFSAMQLLVERSQARFASVFKARGNAFREWFHFAIELEREFGPDDRTKAILSPARTWTFENFKRAQLQGSFTIVVEDGSTVPKTNLGLRAAVEHAAGLGMLNMQDPDQQYEGLKLFGLTRMVPSLDYHVQAALQKQQAFEQWLQNPQAVQQAVQQAQMKLQQAQLQLQQADPTQIGAPVPDVPSLLEGTPLEWREWFNPVIHKQECVKWANTDHMREAIQGPQGRIVSTFVTAHLKELDQHLAERLGPGPGAAPAPAGAARAMANANQEATQQTQPGAPGMPAVS